MPIYTDDHHNECIPPFGVPLISSIGIGPKVTKMIDAATKEWLDAHPEATTTVEDESLEERKLKPSFSLELCRCFDTVADMQAATDLKAGMICHTNGFHSTGDGGGAFYKVTADGDPNGIDVLVLQDNLVANLIIVEPYVTPEQFGAWGDGEHDDTMAWQKAVDFNLPVKASSDEYLCGQIDVTKNIEIDCNNAAFTCNANKLFNCSGEVLATLTGESDYAAYDADYTITDAAYEAYTGFAMLKGTNNFEPAREYYTGGFTCTFFNGKLTNLYPIDVTDVSIEIVNPITVEIANIGDITHTDPTTATHSIEILYGMGCVVRNFTEKSGSSYMVLNFNCCLNCVADNLNIEHSFSSPTNNSYIVAFANSSFCTVQNSYMHNEKWHCVTTGDTYLCYKNKVNNCVLLSDEQLAYCDHENGLGSEILNSTIACVEISGLGIISNVTIKALKNAYRNCVVRICACSMERNAIYTIKDITFDTDQDGNSSYQGFLIVYSSQVAGNTCYIKRLLIQGVNVDGPIHASFRIVPSNQSTAVIEHIKIVDSCIFIYPIDANFTHIDKSSFLLEIDNCHNVYDNAHIHVSSPAYVGNDLIISNCTLHNLAGTWRNVTLNNVSFDQIIGNSLSITGKLFGSGVHSRILESTLTAVDELMITDMNYSRLLKWLNLCRANDGKYYYQLVRSGAIELNEITT